MDCDQAKPLLGAYADGELDPAHGVEVDAHLSGCASCRLVSERIDTLRASISSESLYFTAPRALTTKVHAQVSRKSAGSRSWRWASIAAAIVVAGIGGAVLTRWAGSDDRLVDEVLAEHVRSLMAAHLVDVPSSDQHTVKPWFDGRIDFAPSVADYSANGFPLHGGRLDYLDGRPVAALIYQRKKHFVNVFIWPEASGSPASKPSNAETIHRKGFNLIHWTQKGMVYWAVSDLEEAELTDLVHLLHSPS